MFHTRLLKVPVTCEEANSSPDSKHWKKEMKEQDESDPHGLTPVPKNKSVVGGRYIYSVTLTPVILVMSKTKLDM